MQWLILILGVLSNASASVLVKVAMTAKDSPIQISHPLSIVGNFTLMSGIALYGMAFVLYALALSYLPLNVAHPILTSGSIALVSIASVVFFGEHLSPINLLGIFLIILGVCALTVKPA